MALLLVALALAGCGGTDPPDDPAPAPGTITLRYSITNGVRSNPNLVDPPKGTVYGSIYLAEDVTLSGPRNGAVQYADVETAGVDVEMVDTSEASWKSSPLAPNRYTFLGFYDLDGNGTPGYEPDPGDPVTLPTTNQFEITSGQETAMTVMFDLVYN
jgi:hypothetical protein